MLEMVKHKVQSNEPSHTYPFWDRPKAWPSDTSDYTFLARASHELGRAIFGDQYIEKYTSIDDMQERSEPPDDCDEETWDAFERKCDEFELSFNAMRAEIAKRLALALEAGDLIAALRAKPGGQLTNLATHHWITENAEVRFEYCDMSSSQPFRTKRPIPDACWIYIERNSLAQLLARVSAKVSSSGKASASTNSLPISEPFSQPRAHRKHLVKSALIALYGPSGCIPAGVTEEGCLVSVNDWMRKNGAKNGAKDGAKHGVSKATLRRAKRELRVGRKGPERS
jgi:hypothetical protein